MNSKFLKHHFWHQLVISIAVIFSLVSLEIPNLAFAGVLTSDESGEEIIQTPQESSMTDHKAKVYNISGKVERSAKDSSSWGALNKGDEVIEGDRIKTGPDSYVEIYYDEFYQNFVRIDANTFAEFETIEPTKVMLLDGEIFNTLEGLATGTMYDVATPTSVAGVRGTSFMRGYNAAEGTDSTVVDEGTVEVSPMDEKGSVLTENAFKVQADQALAMDAKSIRAKQFSGFAPKPMSPEQKQHIQKRIFEARQGLAQFAGGDEKLKQARDQWQEVKQSPERLGKIQKEFEKRGQFFPPNGGGPNGPNGPMGPGGNNPGGPGGGNLNPQTKTERLQKIDRGNPRAFEEKSQQYREAGKAFEKRNENPMPGSPFQSREKGPFGNGRELPPAIPPAYENQKKPLDGNKPPMNPIAKNNPSGPFNQFQPNHPPAAGQPGQKNPQAPTRPPAQPRGDRK